METTIFTIAAFFCLAFAIRLFNAKTAKCSSLGILALIFIGAIITTSCEVNKLTQPEVEDEYNYITFNPIIDATVDMIEEPLSKADNGSGSYVISVLEKNVSNDNYRNYASGLFKSLDGISLVVNKSREYSVGVAYYLTDILSEYKFKNDYSINDHPYATDYTEDFIYYEPDHDFFINPFGYWISKSNPDIYHYLLEGDAYLNYDPETENSRETFTYFSGDVESVPIELLRQTTGLNISVNNLNEGKIIVFISLGVVEFGGNIEFEINLTPEQPTYSNLFFGDYVRYQKNYCIQATYVAPDNTETELFSELIQFTERKRKVIEINLSDKNKGQSIFDFTIGSSDIEDEETLEYNLSI